jgi:hypothetical protein
MKKTIFLFALLALAASSCGKGPRGSVPVLDVTKSYPAKELAWQDIATVEYLPLETKDGFMLGEYLPIRYMDDEMIVIDNESDIMFFDRRTGRALHSFNRSGRGPGEYTDIGSIAVDPEAGELFLTTHSDGLRIIVYDLRGKHLRTLDMGGDEWFSDKFHVYDADHLFWYDNEIEHPAPYMLLSRTDTLSTPLSVEFPTRDNMRIDFANTFTDAEGETHSSTGYFTMHGTSVLKTREGYIFAEPGVDTIYSWNRRSGGLTPILARTPSFRSMEYPIAVYIPAQTDYYLLLNTSERRLKSENDMSAGVRSSNILLDRATGEFYEYSLVNGDYVDRREIDIRSSISFPAGQYVDFIQAVTLVGLHEQGKLQGPLAELAATLKEDDNPVLVIATLR